MFSHPFPVTNWQFCRAGIAAACLAMAAPASAGEITKRIGVCEASAGAILADGRIAVGSDDLDQLAIYGPDSTDPVWSEDLGKVDDIEGSTRIGDTIFWITSHSLTSTGEDKGKRQKLLATRAGTDGLPEELGKKFKDLRAVLTDALADTPLDLPDGKKLRDVLNIEGLTATPDGALLIGLRAPLTADKKAIVVLLPEPFKLLKLNQPKTGVDEIYVETIELDARGIRGIERDANGAYLIIAGSPKDGGKRFTLYRWDSSDPPTPITDIDLGGATPEAVIIHKPGLAEILGDNGDVCEDKKSVPIKDRWFPSRLIPY